MGVLSIKILDVPMKKTDNINNKPLLLISLV